jgi:uncharacterized protein (TIGR02217 family)
MFYEYQLDPRITDGARSAVRWKRIKSYTNAGHLDQEFKWENPLHTLDLSYRPHQSATFQTLKNLFHVVMSFGYSGFRAKDWSDYQLDSTNSYLTNIAGDEWQIQRLHAIDETHYYLRDITKPREDVVVWRLSGEIATDTEAEIDYTTGIATFAGHVEGDTYYAVGEFDIPVTFVNDEWVGNFRGTSEDLWIASEPILLEEIRIPAAEE